MGIVPVPAAYEEQHNTNGNCPTNDVLAMRTGIRKSTGNRVCKLIVLKLLF